MRYRHLGLPIVLLALWLTSLPAATVRMPVDEVEPGMTGVGKLTVGKRRLIWIFTHETIDFLRMLLWW